MGGTCKAGSHTMSRAIRNARSTDRAQAHSNQLGPHQAVNKHKIAVWHTLGLLAWRLAAAWRTDIRCLGRVLSETSPLRWGPAVRGTPQAADWSLIPLSLATAVDGFKGTASPLPASTGAGIEGVFRDSSPADIAGCRACTAFKRLQIQSNGLIRRYHSVRWSYGCGTAADVATIPKRGPDVQGAASQGNSKWSEMQCAVL